MTALSVDEAILKAGPVRLRPIMMTTIAMMLGMMPSAISRGEGSEFRAPMSIATIGGVITSTLLTLVVVPVAYLLLARTLERVKSWRASGAHVPQAVRVTGVVLARRRARLADLVDHGFRADRRRHASLPGPGHVPLSFNQALERALSNNEGLKVAKEKVVETQGRVQESKTNFLPQVNLGYNYTPAQRFPVITIPPGVFGPTEQTVRGRLRAAEHPAVVCQPADLHRRPA